MKRSPNPAVIAEVRRRSMIGRNGENLAWENRRQLDKSEVDDIWRRFGGSQTPHESKALRSRSVDAIVSEAIAVATGPRPSVVEASDELLVAGVLDRQHLARAISEGISAGLSQADQSEHLASLDTEKLNAAVGRTVAYSQGGSPFFQTRAASMSETDRKAGEDLARTAADQTLPLDQQDAARQAMIERMARPRRGASSPFWRKR